MALAGCTSAPSLVLVTATPTSAPLPTSTPKPAQVIVNPPDELNLSIQDFPVGWQVNSTDFTAEGAHKIIVVKAQAGLFSTVVSGLVVSTVWVYPSSLDAQTVLTEQRSEYSQKYAVGDPRIGDGSWMFSDANGFEVRFRALNVVAQVQMSSPIYGGSMEETRRWAKQLEDKIRTKRRMGLSPERPSGAAAGQTLGAPSPAPPPTPYTRPGPTPTAIPTHIPTSTPTATATPTPTPLPAIGLLGFISTREGQGLYLTDQRGNKVTRMADTGLFTWSPDGSRLAFQCTGTDSKPSICAINADRSNFAALVPIFAEDGSMSSLAWSPDGQRIAYVTTGSNLGGARTLPQLYIVNSDGTNRRNPFPGGGFNPMGNLAWSPDGKKIAIVASGGSSGDTEVYVVDLEGNKATNVSQYVWRDEGFSWSPDGQWIAFLSNRDGLWDIFKVRPNGTELTRLTNRLNVSSAGVWWSPDGEHLAFIMNTSKPGELPGDLYLVRPDGTEQVRLTVHGRVRGQVAWSPDSTLLAFVSPKDGQTDIRVVTREGRDEYDLTYDSASDAQPAWQPGQVRTAP